MGIVPQVTIITATTVLVQAYEQAQKQLFFTGFFTGCITQVIIHRFFHRLWPCEKCPVHRFWDFRPCEKTCEKAPELDSFSQGFSQVFSQVLFHRFFHRFWPCKKCPVHRFSKFHTLWKTCENPLKKHMKISISHVFSQDVSQVFHSFFTGSHPIVMTESRKRQSGKLNGGGESSVKIPKLLLLINKWSWF